MDCAFHNVLNYLLWLLFYSKVVTLTHTDAHMSHHESLIFAQFLTLTFFLRYKCYVVLQLKFFSHEIDSQLASAKEHWPLDRCVILC